MADRPHAFGVETIELDLQALAAAFARRLLAAGLPVTPAHAIELARALDLVRPVARRRLYWTARAIFVTDPTQVRAFDAVFASVFGGAVPRDDAVEEERALRASAPELAPVDAPAVASGSGLPSPAPGRDDDHEEAELELPVTRASDEERLRRTSFDALQPRELAELRLLMERLELVTPRRRTRRHERRRLGERVDLRRTLRTSMRTAGEPMRLARRRRRVTPRRLVLLCDISGSMEPYARAYLQFLACAARPSSGAEAFVFATRLTRITRALAARNPERALERAAAAAPDWSSGTRIGDALRAFNDRHGRRGMARGAVVVILSDGWERGDPAVVDREMARLRRVAHRIVWVNPRLAARAYSARSGGMLAALPHCDAFVSGHSFDALGEVVAAIGADAWQPPEAPVDTEDDEPWPSATPVAGSSVAMPSGYGPSRGRTTPGWGAA